MACETFNQEIDGVEYSVTQWPADKAFMMKFKLLKIFGPALAQLANDKIDDSAKISGALTEIFKTAEPKDVLEIIKECVLSASVDGERITSAFFTETYNGERMMEAYKVFVFVIRTNYSNLFSGKFAETLLALNANKQET